MCAISFTHNPIRAPPRILVQNLHEGVPGLGLRPGYGLLQIFLCNFAQIVQLGLDLLLVLVSVPQSAVPCQAAAGPVAGLPKLSNFRGPSIHRPATARGLPSGPGHRCVAHIVH